MFSEYFHSEPENGKFPACCAANKHPRLVIVFLVLYVCLTYFTLLCFRTSELSRSCLMDLTFINGNNFFKEKAFLDTFLYFSTLLLGFVLIVSQND